MYIIWALALGKTASRRETYEEIEVVVAGVVVVVDEVLLDIVEVTCEATNVTGRSLVSMMLVEAMEELKNLEVILLTSFLTVFKAISSDVVVAVSDTTDSLGLGVIGILLLLLDLATGTVTVRKSVEK